MNMSRSKWLLLAAVILLGVGALVLFSGKGTVKNYPPKDGPIVAFGDSLVAGNGSTEGNDFVSRLSRLVREPIQNLGVPGDTTTLGLNRIDDVLKLEPRIVLVLFGGNDYLQRFDRSQTFDNLRQIIRKLQAEGAIVLLLGVRGGTLSDNFAEPFKDLAKETESAFVPNVLDGLITDRNLMADSVHPNDAGYKIVAEKVYPVLKEILR